MFNSDVDIELLSMTLELSERFQIIVNYVLFKCAYNLFISLRVLTNERIILITFNQL